MADAVALSDAFMAAVAGVAVFGVWRARRVFDVTGDARVARLAWFFALTAASQVFRFASVALFRVQLAGEGLDRDAFELVDVLFLAEHAAWLGALGFGLLAVGVKRGTTAAAFAPLLLWAEPALRAVESALALWLVVRTSLNYRSRANVGSLAVAAGFFLVCASFVLLLLVNAPLGAKSPTADAVLLAGVAVLAAAVPRVRL